MDAGNSEDDAVNCDADEDNSEDDVINDDTDADSFGNDNYRTNNAGTDNADDDIDATDVDDGDDGSNGNSDLNDIYDQNDPALMSSLLQRYLSPDLYAFMGMTLLWDIIVTRSKK